jgi:hypothetical protein
MPGKMRILVSGVSLLIIVCTIMLIGWVGTADSAEKTPVTRYWMSVSTEKGAFPGMTPGSMGPGALLGAIMGRGGDSGRRLQLQVNSPKSLPSDPEATHDIPPGQNMGPTLPLITPDMSRDQSEPQEDRPEKKMEKPKMRMLVYWGCSETIRPGQPYVIDTEKASLAEFGRVFQGRYVSSQNPPSPHGGRSYADWPNKKDSKRVPANGSLVGNHFVHGNYVPDIKFAIDSGHDFMAPVEFTSKKGSPAESFFFQWNSIPTATGYFATAMGHDGKTGTMIIWTSSDVRETGGSLMNFLPNDDVRRLIREKVVMPPSVTQCVVPKGIFKDAQGAMIQFIAYGDELNVGYPPKPKDPIWTVKVRRKSTSMLPLMEMAGRGASSGEESGGEGEQSTEKKEGLTPGKLFKGIFGR